MQDKQPPAPSTFGQNVRGARERVKWTQQQLSDRMSRYGVKLDTSAITRIENGSREPRLKEAQGIAAALGVELSDLVSDAPSKLQIDKLWDDLDRAHFGLVDTVYEFGVARRALTRALDEMEAEQIEVENVGVMRDQAKLRAIRDWQAIRSDVDRRTLNQNPPYDESIFDAET
jgi:transcriptional regulator with XRE-family HTH domain